MTELLPAGSAAALLQVGARVSGFMLIAPIFSSRAVPMRLRAAFVLVLSVVLVPAAAANTVTPTLAALFAETLVGFTIGFGAAVLIGAAESAGDYLSVQIGLSGAALMDPLSGHQTAVLGQLMRMAALALLLAADAHLFMVDSVAASFHYVPAGATLDIAGGLAALVGTGGVMIGLGFRFAAPVIVAVLTANVSLAVLTRAAPQMNIIGIAFPLQIFLGLFAFGASIPFMGAIFADWTGSYDSLITRLLTALLGGG
jgi:flagellar biosynthesis protein FliR